MTPPPRRPPPPRLISTALTAALLGGLAALGPAPARADTFVLIVANNRSLRPHLPDLQYADDDGIRYYQLWEALLPEARLTLLAEPDATTARANPGFVRLGRAPTRANLFVEVAALAEAVRQARRTARPTTLYLVFAGHGDVEAGQGFVELADGRLAGAELQALVTRIDAGETHLILDSCNSYFMVRPRKPGGRPIGADLAQQPAFAGSTRVGAFLSTSSEQTVYEWSEVQSGIFSYLVRSGLMGGADANQDGRVTYDELRGFVGVASGTVPNPAARPNVFARGPGGDGGRVLLDLNPGRARALELPAGQRFILRNADGFRLAELHTEAGFNPSVRLWGGRQLRLDVLVAAPAPDGRPARAVYHLPDAGSVKLATLTDSPAGDRPRGGERTFQQLFEQPFGPRAFARHQAEQRAAPAAVYGISRDDTSRLRLHLELLARTRRDDRLGSAFWQGVVALPLALTPVLLCGGAGSPCSREDMVFSGAVGTLLGGLALKNLFPTRVERLAERGRAAAASGEHPARWLPALNHDLDAAAASARRWRIAGGVTFGVLFGALTAILAADTLDDPSPEDGFWLGTLAAAGAGGTWLLLQESATERQLRALKADPLWDSVSVAIAPAPGGLRLAFGARY